jgi:hypothetical protein
VAAGFLQRDPIAHLLGQHLNGQRDHGNRLWLLLNSELWFRMHIEGQSVDEMRSAITASTHQPAGVPRHEVATAN